MTFMAYADRDVLAMQVANHLGGALQKLLNTQERVSFAVPGGTTPGPVFDLLSRMTLDWARVTIVLTDERWVSERDERSNAALVRRRLLSGEAARAGFVPYHHTQLSVEAGAQAAGKVVSPLLPLSLALLGMGADMHTASLFPNAEGLTQALSKDAPPLCPIRVAGQGISRVTLSAQVLRDASEKHLLITGTDKREALDRAMLLPEEQAPIAAVLKGGTVHWAA
ncbi:MAG: 6-phosphogluconolactonase [Pseudomonadota bacterium]